jgi:hypothetical protein
VPTSPIRHGSTGYASQASNLSSGNEPIRRNAHTQIVHAYKRLQAITLMTLLTHVSSLNRSKVTPETSS